MKKLALCLVVFSVMLLSSHAIQAQNSLSFGLAYGFDLEEAGLQIGGMHQLNEKMSIGADLVYYFIGDEEFFGMKFSTTAMEINGNFRYSFLEKDGFELYGLGTLGIHIIRMKFSYEGSSESDSDSEVALGIGGGAQYNLGSVKIFAEPRLFLSGFDQFQFAAGVRVGL